MTFRLPEFSAFFGKRPKRFLSIDFSPNLTEVVYGERVSDFFRLLAYDSQKIPTQEGQPNEPPETFIRRFVTENRIAEKETILSIADQVSVVFKYGVLPQLPEREIVEAAQWHFKDVMTDDTAKAVIGWQVVRDQTDEEGNPERGYLFAAIQRETVDRYLAIISGCQLKPVAITLGPFNYSNLIRILPQKAPVSAILDIDYDETVLSIYCQDRLHFVRRIPVSWKNMLHALTVALISQKGEVKLTYEEAEVIKDRYGYPLNQTEVIEGKIRASHLISLVRPILETLVTDLKFSFDYFTSSFDVDRPSVLYLTGGGSNLRNLDQFLAQELGIETTHLPLPDQVVFTQGDKQSSQYRNVFNRIMSAVGASIRGPDGINLLPREIREQQIQKIQRMLFAFVAAVLGVFVFISITFSVLRKNGYEKRLQAARMHLNGITGIEELQQRIDARQNIIRKIHRGEVPVDGLLKVISRSIPDYIVLDQLQLELEKRRVTLIGRISGKGDKIDSALTEFMQQLEATSFFVEVNLVQSERVDLLQQFEIQCEIIWKVKSDA